MFAVIENNKKQYKVFEEKKYKIDAPEATHKEGDTINFSSVLVLFDGEKTFLGTPNVDGAQVEASVLGTVREKKVEVNKFHSKKRYARVGGERPEKLLIEIKKISKSEKKGQDSKKMNQAKENEK